MQLDSARELKAQLQEELVTTQPVVAFKAVTAENPVLGSILGSAGDQNPAVSGQASESWSPALHRALTLFEASIPTSGVRAHRGSANLRALTPALGISPHPKGGFRLAIRVQEAVGADQLVEYFTDQAHGEADVRMVPRAVAHSLSPRDRHRPVCGGISIGHPTVGAGTLCCFVTGPDEQIQALSTNHVIAAANDGRPGDPILQPAPADNGDASRDKIGCLGRVEPLLMGQVNRVDAALCTLDAGVGHDVVGGRTVVTDIAESGIEAVTKHGRSSGETRGHVSAVELDGVVIDIPGLGFAEFDGLVEVDGGQSPFSEAGDSGAMVTDEQGLACLAMVIAGDDNQYSWGTPLANVLATLEVTLVG